MSKSIRAAEDVNVKFKVTDTTTGTPVKGLGLSAWISMREGNKLLSRHSAARKFSRI